MAGTGPAPKPDAQRRRRNAPTHGAERVIQDDGVLRGPKLADVVPMLATDPVIAEAVDQWWTRWRLAPQAQAFIDTDWGRLAMLAPLVAAYWAEPDTKLLSEIRLNEERLGATLADRLKVRLRVEAAETAPVIAIVSARDRFADRLSDS